LRRYTLAVLGAAQPATLPSSVIYTDAAADAEASQVEPMGTWMTMPFGWRISHVKAEQPTTVSTDLPFVRLSNCVSQFRRLDLIRSEISDVVVANV